MIERYHATVLSNFIRGYDKYARRYSKSNIPESTFAGRFFLLPRDEIHLGIDKATRLLKRTGLPGDRVLVLETRAQDSELRPSQRTGVGEMIERDFIDVNRVHVVEEGAQLRAIGIEDACAFSLACFEPQRRRWQELAPRTVSLLPVARGCQAACEFCFSAASVSKEIRGAGLDWRRINDALAAAQGRGAVRAVITGGGEPGLLKDEDLERLIGECARYYAKVVLITNGYALARRSEPEREAALRRLADAGLSVLAISRHHHDATENARIMRLAIESDAVARSWHARREALARLSVRFICVLQQGGIENPASVDAYLEWAAALGVSEVCFKELYVSTSRESVYHAEHANEWSRAHQVPLKLVLDRARERGWERIAELPWGAPIFAAQIGGRAMRVAAYTEPSVFWELHHGICRSWNLMADGRCLASLEDRGSEVSVA